nr:DUF6084 family protein [Saccharopolyspora sp. HNM0983]
MEFEVLGIAAEEFAASPILQARVRIGERTGERVHAVALHAQLRIDAQRRDYRPGEQQALVDMFGDPSRWGRTLRPFLWTQCSTTVPGFRDSTEVQLPIAVTYDFEVAASRYLHALREGTVPLSFGFGGTVFTRGGTGFSVERISWEHDVPHDMPVSVWRELVQRHFPASGWLRLDHETLGEMHRFKSRRGLGDFDQVCRALLDAAEERA